MAALHLFINMLHVDTRSPQITTGHLVTVRSYNRSKERKTQIQWLTPWSHDHIFGNWQLAHIYRGLQCLKVYDFFHWQLGFISGFQ